MQLGIIGVFHGRGPMVHPNSLPDSQGISEGHQAYGSKLPSSSIAELEITVFEGGASEGPNAIKAQEDRKRSQGGTEAAWRRGHGGVGVRTGARRRKVRRAPGHWGVCVCVCVRAHRGELPAAPRREEEERAARKIRDEEEEKVNPASPPLRYHPPNAT